MGISLINMKISALAFAGSALFSLMVVFATRSDVSQTVGATVSARESNQFEDHWNALQTSTIPKTASLREEPKPIRTVKIEPESEVIPPSVVYEDKPRKPKYHEPKDVCRRHGMHKVQRGRSWRCRR